MQPAGRKRPPAAPPARPRASTTQACPPAPLSRRSPSPSPSPSVPPPAPTHPPTHPPTSGSGACQREHPSRGRHQPHAVVVQVSNHHAAVAVNRDTLRQQGQREATGRDGPPAVLGCGCGRLQGRVVRGSAPSRAAVVALACHHVWRQAALPLTCGCFKPRPAAAPPPRLVHRACMHARRHDRTCLRVVEVRCVRHVVPEACRPVAGRGRVCARRLRKRGARKFVRASECSFQNGGGRGACIVPAALHLPSMRLLPLAQQHTLAAGGPRGGQPWGARVRSACRSKPCAR